MPQMNHYDVIIIGTGAGGGTLAYTLAPSGKHILLLERGDYVPREKDNWNPRAVNVEAKYNTKEVWRDHDGQPLHPHTNYYVGGNTKFYGAAIFRLRREDFGEIKHYGGVSPAWPITYEEMEPYYSQAERLYQVHGQRGEDPTEPHTSAPYPYPPVSHEPRIPQLSDDFARLGLRPFHTPLGVMLDEADRHHSRCIRCNTCDGFPCLVYAKADAQVCGVDPALQYPHVTLLTNAHVSRLATNASGREVTAVHVERGGWQEVYSAEIVVVSCGAINSAALLLRSANDRHPDGLANSSGVVEGLMQQQTKCAVHGHECHVGLFARNLFVGQRIPLAGVAHQNGTIRFGIDPKTSALDVNCKAHDVDNLYVVDASFVQSSGAVNPALTIMANALRVGDHLQEKLG